MTNIRIDENGLSKSPVYDPTAPLLHRSAVTAVEGLGPGGVGRHRHVRLRRRSL